MTHARTDNTTGLWIRNTNIPWSPSRSEQDQDGTSSVLILLASCQQTCMTYTIAVCTVKTPDDGQRNCPKHVEFYSKNKFEKLVHLVGFIIRVYHDARSPECQTKHCTRFCQNPHALISSGVLSCTTADLKAVFGDLVYLYCVRSKLLWIILIYFKLFKENLIKFSTCF